MSGELPAGSLSAYLGYFMATSGTGCPDGVNARSRRPGTLTEDIPKGTVDFAAWDGTPPPGALPKQPQQWAAHLWGRDSGDEALIDAYVASIEHGTPAILCFAFWNPVDPRALVLKTSAGDALTVTAYEWGEPLSSTASLREEDPKVPYEEWDEKGGIGHAVTGVGFFRDRERLWVIVHDNWSTTAADVVIPWNHVIALITLGRCRG